MVPASLPPIFSKLTARCPARRTLKFMILIDNLARAAWFAYLNPRETDLLYYNWFRRRDNWSPTEDLWDKGTFNFFSAVRHSLKETWRLIQMQCLA